MAKIIKRVEIIIEVDTDANTQTTTRCYENFSRFEAIGLLHYECERITQMQWDDDHLPKESEVKPDEPTEQS